MLSDNPWIRYALIGAGVFALLAFIGWLLLSDDEGEAAATTTATVAETTTTEAETTTTTVEETTTTVEETTTTVEETTTTEPFDPLVLADDGIGGVDFGASPGQTIAYATAVFGGPPEVDTGWIDGLTSPYGVCPEPEVRGVEWGTSAGGFGSAFTLLFTNSTTTHASGEHFFGYFYFGGSPLLATVEGITYGSTNLQLQTEIPSVVIEEDPLDPGAGLWRSDVDETDMNLLYGFSTSVNPDGTLTSVNGGVTCGE